eukprot:jgi/Mesvir1/876/Mv17442-RA.1
MRSRSSQHWRRLLAVWTTLLFLVQLHNCAPTPPTAVIQDNIEGGPPRLAECLAKLDLSCAAAAHLAGADHNEADEEGHTPLWVASSIGFVEGVRFLLQRRVHVELAATGGRTPLLVAVEREHAEVVRLLLAYGADPDKNDTHGMTPRRLAEGEGSWEIMELFAQHKSQGGAEAFEDPPGTWLLFKSEPAGNAPALEFFFNKATEEKAWSRPPVCAWDMRELDTGQRVYFNRITGQHKWTVPRALSWRLIKKRGSDIKFWYNFAANVTQRETPAEIPKRLLEDVAAWEGMFWNTATGELSGSEPRERMWNKVLDTVTRKHFWFHPQTGESTWVQPNETGWKSHMSELYQQIFYHNELTNEMQWAKPEVLAWERHDEL